MDNLNTIKCVKIVRSGVLNKHSYVCLAEQFWKIKTKLWIIKNTSGFFNGMPYKNWMKAMSIVQP